MAEQPLAVHCHSRNLPDAQIIGVFPSFGTNVLIALYFGNSLIVFIDALVQLPKSWRSFFFFIYIYLYRIVQPEWIWNSQFCPAQKIPPLNMMLFKIDVDLFSWCLDPNSQIKRDTVQLFWRRYYVDIFFNSVYPKCVETYIWICARKWIK